MSYLDVPRIHICGRFYAFPSTLNNDPAHYDPDNTRPSPWQTPDGDHSFRFKNVSVRSAVGPDGPVSTDPIIGAAVMTDDKVPARIVDLDVYQQGVPTLYAMRIQIPIDGKNVLDGMLDPAVCNQLWWKAVMATRSWKPDDYGKDSFGGDMNASAVFQSVIRVKKEDWPDSSSTVLNQLRSATILENDHYLVSFKIVTDGYQNVPQNANFKEGRVVGTLGPVKMNEPLYNPGQRWLEGRTFSEDDPWYYPAFFNAPFKVDKERKKLVLDLANGICRQTAGGPPADLGTVTAAVSFLDPPAVELGTVDYSAFAYENNALITELELSGEQIDMLAGAPLQLEMSRTDLGPQAIFSEDAGALNYEVEVRPVRMEGAPGTKATTTVYVNKLGTPVPNKQLKLFIESVYGNTPGATVPPNNPGNTRQSSGAITAAITPTDSNGFATVTIEVQRDPGYRTPQLDGQLYFVIVYDPEYPHPDWSKVPPTQRHLISVIAYSNFQVQTDPSWDTVKTIMTPYIKLYPSMKEQLDLTDPHSFHVFAMNPPWKPVYNAPPGPLGIEAGAIPYLMSRDFNDSKFMPISRDLSKSKLMTVMHYIKNMQDKEKAKQEQETSNP